uniref:Uncharacterized protein n=1 Tax=Anguilla anguilla TaxID=7936 RepID=A0A0E9XKI2_ANGAN
MVLKMRCSLSPCSSINQYTVNNCFGLKIAFLLVIAVDTMLRNCYF